MADEEERKAEEAEEKSEADGKEPEKAPGTKSPEKTLPQSEVNKLMADERRKHAKELADVRAELTSLQQSIADEKKAANDAAAEEVEALRKNLPDAVVELLDAMQPVDQLKWLNKHSNELVKQTIPPLPESAQRPGQGPRIEQII